MQRIIEFDVRIWLPGEAEAVQAGHVFFENNRTMFLYNRRYLKKETAISIYSKDLMMGGDEIEMGDGRIFVPSLRDALPDLWGRRAIAAGYRHCGFDPYRGDDIDEYVVAMQMGPDRIGALDIRLPSAKMLIKKDRRPPLKDLMALADLIEANKEVEDRSLGLDPTLRHDRWSSPKSPLY